MEDIVNRSRILAATVLKDESRFDGTPFIGHPDGVARIVADEIGLPQDCVAAVYLHEATRIHRDVDISDFPADVRAIVEALNNIASIKPKDTRLEAENYKKLIIQYSTDPRAVVIKIADRLEVMRSLSMFPKLSRDQKLLETLMLYIPLAHQLGLYNIKSELENIYFRYADPEQFRHITGKLRSTEKERQRLTDEFIEPLKKKLSDAGISYKLKMRTKTAYSIYRKMMVQKVPFEGVFDVFAIRFIIDCDPDPAIEKDLCWKVYSYVTEEYEPDTKRLRDWLTVPKPNGYESLHITVKNKRGSSLEVQIRTARMDAEAENGAAAHWAYKGIRHEQSMDRWLTSVRYNLEHPAEVKAEDIPVPPENEIFVFTPTGELRTLKAGSSVLDFAFNIHSRLGCQCIGGRVNGRAVKIGEKLKTGDIVEIITQKNQRPGKDWLSWVVTAKARTKIKQELDAEERKLANEGREILERRLKNWKLEFTNDMRLDYMKAHKFSNILPFMASIATGDTDVNDIKTFILDYDKLHHHEEEKEEKVDITKAATGSDDILILNAKDVKGIQYKMARCCNPVFGDDVFGFVTRTQGITIHRQNCPNATRLHERYGYRIQRVQWQDGTSGGNFQVTLRIEALLDHSVLSKIMETIYQFKASVRTFDVQELEKNHEQIYIITAKVLVPSNLEIDKIVSQVGMLKLVNKITRI